MSPDPTPADPRGNLRTFTYDTRGRVTSWSPAPGPVTTSVYDRDGRLLYREPPDDPGDRPPDEPHVVG